MTPTDPGPQRSAESHSASALYAGDDGFQGGAHGGAGWPGAVHDSGDAITGPLVSNVLCAMLGCSSANAVAPGEAGQARVSNDQYAVEMAAALTAAKTLGAVAGAIGRGAGAITKGAPRAYSVAFEAKLTENGVGSYAAHFAEANEQLLKSMAHPEMADALRVTLGQHFEGTLISPSGSGRVLGSSPPGWTWHHVPEQPGILHLVPRAEHAPGSAWQPILHPGGEGGMAKWGSRF